MSVGTRLNMLYEDFLSKNIVKNKKDFCQILSIDHTTYAKYISDNINFSINEKNSDSFENANININWLLTGKGSMYRDSESLLLAEREVTYSDRSLATTKIPLLAQKASAGPGQEWLEDDEIVQYVDVMDIIPGLKQAHPGAFTVRGFSMNAVGILDGDVVVFDTRPISEYRDDVYVLAIDGNVFVKLCEFEPVSKKIRVLSAYNSKDMELVAEFYDHDETTADRLKIFGRVIALIRENRYIRR